MGTTTASITTHSIHSQAHSPTIMAYQIVYQPDPTRTDSFCAYVDDKSEYQKWVEGDKSVALSSFVGRFDVFHSQTGHQGQWETASKSQIENDLGVKNKDEAIELILTKGSNKGLQGSGTNAAQDAGNSVSRGAYGGGHGG